MKAFAMIFCSLTSSFGIPRAAHQPLAPSHPHPSAHPISALWIAVTRPCIGTSTGKRHKIRSYWRCDCQCTALAFLLAVVSIARSCYARRPSSLPTSPPSLRASRPPPNQQPRRIHSPLRPLEIPLVRALYKITR